MSSTGSALCAGYASPRSPGTRSLLNAGMMNLFKFFDRRFNEIRQRIWALGAR
eukprot:SAG31_NODE_41434_length_276_cov_0.581921_2_plen_52_part_01